MGYIRILYIYMLYMGILYVTIWDVLWVIGIHWDTIPTLLREIRQFDDSFFQCTRLFKNMFFYWHDRTATHRLQPIR